MAIYIYRYYLERCSNLRLFTDGLVTKVLTKTNHWTGKTSAYGVEVVDKNNRKHEFTAKKEVILSAGAIGSPQILLLSGIGPKSDLQKLNIPVVQNLPVGKNLQNHVSVGVGVKNIFLFFKVILEEIILSYYIYFIPVYDQ